MYYRDSSKILQNKKKKKKHFIFQNKLFFTISVKIFNDLYA